MFCQITHMFGLFLSFFVCHHFTCMIADGICPIICWIFPRDMRSMIQYIADDFSQINEKRDRHNCLPESHTAQNEKTVKIDTGIFKSSVAILSSPVYIYSNFEQTRWASKTNMTTTLHPTSLILFANICFQPCIQSDQLSTKSDWYQFLPSRLKLLADNLYYVKNQMIAHHILKSCSRKERSICKTSLRNLIDKNNGRNEWGRFFSEGNDEQSID